MSSIKSEFALNCCPPAKALDLHRDAAARALLNAMAADPEFDAVKLETYWRSIQNETLKACAAAHRIARRIDARAALTRAASRRAPH